MKRCALTLVLLILFSSFASAAEKIEVDANAAMLVDQASGQVLYAKNERERAYPCLLYTSVRRASSFHANALPSSALQIPIQIPPIPMVHPVLPA